MRNICVIGVGYVGLTTGTCFADLGNRVVSIDINEERIANLNKGILPIYEPGLKEMVERNVAAGRLKFTNSYTEGLKDAEFVFICVGTPSGVDGEADLRYVRDAAETVAKMMDHSLIIINKSTVPVGTGDWVADIVNEHQPKPIEFAVVSCPEFLREGTALRDFMNPDRTVLGSTDRHAADRVAQLHLPLRAPIIVTDLRTAEMIKYASNAFLATKISFINEIANICEALGADVKEVATGMGYDTRIGARFLEAGLGYGGSCFAGEETLFTVTNDGQVKAQSLQEIFAEAGSIEREGEIEVIYPENKWVLGLNPENGCPEVVQVNAFTRRPFTGDMVNMETEMGRSLTVTSDHPVLIFNPRGFEVIPAHEVKEGNQLMLLADLPPLEPTTELNLIDLLAGTALEADVYVSPTDDSFTALYGQYSAHIPKSMLKYPDEIRQNNRMSLAIYRHLVAEGVLTVPVEKLQLYTAKGAATKINALIRIDEGFMRMLGYYLAEGCIAKDTGRAGAQRERVMFSFHENEIEYITDVQNLLASYGLKFIERHSTNSLSTLVSSRIFAWLVRDILGCGTNSNDKSLPIIALSASRSLRMELVRGAFSGDGSATLSHGGKNLRLEYATTSKLLADGMALLLQSLGIVPSVCKCMMNKSVHLAYLIRVSGYEQILQLQDVFGDKRREQITEILGGYQRKIAQHGFQRMGAWSVVKVSGVEHQSVQQDVYSLETTTGVVIVGSGIVMHQCFPKDVKALAHMANIQGRHPQLLEAVMEINDDQRLRVIAKLEDIVGDLKGKVVGLLGLAFKENTDDMRESASITIAEHLQKHGAVVKGYDPVAMDVAHKIMPYLNMAEDAYELAKGCDALIVVTPWNEFKQLDMEIILKNMKGKVIIDGRNLYEPAKMRSYGFEYRGVGRGY